MQINNKKYNNQNFTSLSPLAKPLGAFYNPNATIPTLIIESGVTIGRSIEANKRGGKKEAADRFIEQGASAAVWIWGVQVLKKAGDFLGKKLLKMDNLDFSLGRDILRNPVKNNKIGAKEAAFKTGNLFISTALATYFIGFMLPKISSKLSEKFSDKNKQEEPKTLNPPSIEQFKNKTSKKEKNNQIAFTSLLDKSLGLAHVIENNSTARLLMTDTGVIAGRCKNAKSVYKKIENLFRDISSIYFYLFCTSHVVKGLNKLSKNTDIDPKILSKTVDRISDFKGNKEDFLKQNLASISESDKTVLNDLFKSKEIISLEEFCAKFPEFKDKARLMSELQPVFNENRVLTRTQAADVLSNAKTSDPEFLKDAFSAATKGASSDKLKFVSKKSLENMRSTIDDFIKQVYKESNGTVDADLIKKVANKNIAKNFGFYSLGTAISIFALGTLIPKIQYAITRKLTHSSKRPE